MSTENQGDALSLLVGEGKKFKTVEDLAKGKVESDAYIESLKRQADELRQELEKRDTIDDILQKVSKVEERSVESKNLRVQDDEDREQRNGNPVDPTARADIMGLVTKALESKEKERVAKANVDKVRNELVKIWGTEYPTKLEQRTKELGMSRESVAFLAETSPEALVKLVGDSPKPVVHDNVPSSKEVDSSKFANGAPQSMRNKAWYDELKAKDKKTYFSAAVQTQMHKDAQALKDKFFSKG